MDENEMLRRALKEAAFIVALGVVLIVSLDIWGI